MSVEHYENFPVASVLCPPRLRPAIVAVYHFARTADDLADEGDAPAAERLAALQDYRALLWRCASGDPGPSRWPQVFGPLARAIQAHALPLPLLDDLLDAFMQDVAQPLYDDRAALLDYCRRSANPVGRLLLHLYGVHEPSALRQSDAVCSALQLINFWQDLSRDLPRGRCYVPRDDAARHGLTLDQLLARPASLPQGGAERALVRDLAGWARALMLEGAPLVHAIPGRAGWALRLVVQGGLRILEKIAHMDHASFDHRPMIGAADLPVLLWRAATRPTGPAA